MPENDPQNEPARESANESVDDHQPGDAASHEAGPDIDIDADHDADHDADFDADPPAHHHDDHDDHDQDPTTVDTDSSSGWTDEDSSDASSDEPGDGSQDLDGSGTGLSPTPPGDEDLAPGDAVEQLLPALEQTGHEGVDVALATLDELASSSVHEHVAVFEATHEELRRALNDVATTSTPVGEERAAEGRAAEDPGSQSSH